MSYRDMTFCSGDGCVLFKDCPRALTPEVKDRAARAQMPIAKFCEPKALVCYMPPERKRAAKE